MKISTIRGPEHGDKMSFSFDDEEKTYLPHCAQCWYKNFNSNKKDNAVKIYIVKEVHRDS